MKKIVTILFLLFFVSIQAQKVKKITKKIGLNESETYYVLKSNKKLKHGKYFEFGYYPKKKIKCTGEYSNGKKTGIWVEYHPNSVMVKNKGSYTNGEKSGTWTFYNYVGKLLQEYDYSSEKVIWPKGDRGNYDAFINGSLINTTLQKPPSYIGSVSTLARELSHDFAVNYIWDEKSRPLKLNVDISILLRKDGTVGDIKYNNDMSNDDMKVYLIKEINSRKNKWLVAEYNGEKVDAYLDVKFGVSFSNYID